MAFRFSKRIKIAPGIKVNVGLRGVSASVGGRGGSVNISKRGVSAGASIPGTGLSYRKNLSSSSSQRAMQREQKTIERIEKEEQRAEALSCVQILLDKETGVVSVNDGNGEPLKGKEKTLFWEQQSERIEDWLIENADEINGDVDLLNNIHFDMPSADSEPEYQHSNFDRAEPVEPSPVKQISFPIERKAESLGFFAGLFASKKKLHQEKTEQLAENFKQAVEKYEEDTTLLVNEHKEKVAEWQSNLDVWQKSEATHNSEQEKKAKQFAKDIRTDENLMDSILANEIESIEWPRETLISYSIVNNAESVWLDVDLPEIEDLPQKVASLSANKRRLTIKNKAKKQLQLEYAHHIHAIALRLSAYCLFAVPTAQEVVISGYSQRLNSATGHVNDDYLYSIKFTRAGMLELNYKDIESIKPIDAVERFEHVRKMTATGIIKEIQPFEI